MKAISKLSAINTMLVILSIVLVFHIGVLTQLIPYSIVWAGKLNSVEEMRIFETTSIVINLFMMTTLFIKRRNVHENKTNKVVDLIIWLFVILFALNTVGNLFSETWLELLLGGLLTISSTVFCFIIVKK